VKQRNTGLSSGFRASIIQVT